MKSKLYVPILKAKPNELKALDKTTDIRVGKIVPLLEVPNPNTTAKYYTNEEFPKLSYVDKISNQIAKVMEGKKVYIDGNEFFDSTYTETGEHVYLSLHEKLTLAGVNTVPVVGIDRWVISDYRKSIMDVDSNGEYLIRIDKDMIEDSYDEEYFTGQFEEVLSDLKALPKNCGVLVDLGDVCNSSIDEIINDVNNVLNLLSSFGFSYHILAGCSIPSSINEAVSKKDSSAIVIRKEMVVWKAIYESNVIENLIFGDYCVRGPNSATSGIFPDVNGKIRYTIDDAYFISRGHSQREVDKWGQMRDVSKRVIESGYFVGREYSWADDYIYQCYKGTLPTGGAGTWIGVDTNHHLAYVVDEVHQFKAKKSTTKKVIVE